jgi:hypothetical protein
VTQRIRQRTWRLSRLHTTPAAIDRQGKWNPSISLRASCAYGYKNPQRTVRLCLKLFALVSVLTRICLLIFLSKT